MFIYLLYIVMPVIIWFMFSLFSREHINTSDQMKKKYVIWCGVALFLILALKHYGVGSGDGQWYYYNWKYFSNISFEQFLNIYGSFDIENGYLFSIWALSHVFKEPQFVFVFYGLLVSVAVSNFIYKNCKDPVIAFVMFNCLGLWGFMVQGIRQGIAMSICLFAFEACENRKFIKFMALILLAMFFHASAVVFFPVYIFRYLKMNFKGYMFTAIATVIALISLDNIFQFVNMVINDSYGIGEIESTSGGVVSTLIYILILIAVLVFYGRDKVKPPEISFFFYLTLCGFLLFIMRYFVNSIVQRVSYYYMFGQMALLSAVIKDETGKARPFISMAVIEFCIAIAIYKASYSTLVPYYFFWQ